MPAATMAAAANASRTKLHICLPQQRFRYVHLRLVVSVSRSGRTDHRSGLLVEVVALAVGAARSRCPCASRCRACGRGGRASRLRRRAMRSARSGMRIGRFRRGRAWRAAPRALTLALRAWLARGARARAWSFVVPVLVLEAVGDLVGADFRDRSCAANLAAMEAPALRLVARRDSPTRVMETPRSLCLTPPGRVVF